MDKRWCAMTLTPQQVKDLGYDPSEPGSVLRKTAGRAIALSRITDSKGFQGHGGIQTPSKTSRCVKSTPAILWVDYQIKSLNRTRYIHWSKARREVEAAKGAWERRTGNNVTLRASGWLVHIVSFRSRMLDSDNFIAGAKTLRDSIAKSLGVDDADTFICWHYHQLIGEPHGTLVIIQ